MSNREEIEQLIQRLEEHAQAWSATSYIVADDINGPGSPKEHALTWIAAQHLRRLLGDLPQSENAIDKNTEWPPNEHYEAGVRTALAVILKEPYGCQFCDSGKLRNPAKGHAPDCGFALAEAALNGHATFTNDPRECPACNHPNQPAAKWCSGCGEVFSE